MDERAYARYMSDVAYFITRMEQNPNSKYFMPVALAYNKMEKYDEAIEICRKAVERFPSYCPVKTLLAEAYIYKGDAADAKPLLFDVITEDPENYKALKLLGTIYKSTDETGEALKYFKAAYIRAPEDEDLKRSIEELGASVSPDDLFEEYMKKNKGALWGNAEEKSYNDIEKHIRSAEVMMTDLVADTKISDNLVSGNDPVTIPEVNAISDTELDNIFQNASASQPETQTPVSKNSDKPKPPSDAVSDDELERLLAGAAATANEPGNNQPQGSSLQQEGGSPDEILEHEIENSGDYSALENILETQAAKDASEYRATEKSNIEISDVLSALESNSDDSLDDIRRTFDTQKPFDRGDFAVSPQEEPSAFPGATDAEEKDFFVLDEDALNDQQIFDRVSPVADTDTTNLDSVTVSSNEIIPEQIDENIATPIDAATAQPDDTDFDEPSGNKPAEPLVEDIVAKLLEEDATPFVVKQGKIIEDFTVISNSDENNDDMSDSTKPLNIDQTINEVEKMTNKSPMEFTLEDMIGDDKEDAIISEREQASKDLGESVPFAQRDILDEIFFSASESGGENLAEQIDEQANIDSVNSEKKEKTMRRLLKFQSSLEKLKKG